MMQDPRCYLVVPLRVEGPTPDYFAVFERREKDEDDPRFLRLTKAIDVPEGLRVMSEPLHVTVSELIRIMAGGIS